MHVTIWKFVSNNSQEYHHMISNGATTTHNFPFTHNNWSQVNIENKKIIDTNSTYPTCIFTWVSSKISLGKLKMFEIKKGEF